MARGGGRPRALAGNILIPPVAVEGGILILFLKAHIGNLENVFI